MAHERYTVTSSEALSAGPAVIRVDIKYDGGGIGKGETVTLFINGTKVGEGRITKSVPARFGAESFDVGMDNGSPVSDAYQPPFAYPGTIKKVTITLRPSPLSASDQQTVLDEKRLAALTIE
jgi:arylsulfatase